MEIIVRATVMYFVLWAIARGTGKRELTQLTAFELILLVTMGDLIQQGVTQEDMSLTGATLAVGTLAAWILLFSAVSSRFKGARPVLEGVPLVVLRDGQPIDEALAMERFSLDELKEEAREQGIADLDDVQLAVLEPDGRVSFIQSSGRQQTGDDTKLT
jgi:uncharacterized membrane protein YcaP (DUF421 family)